MSGRWGNWGDGEIVVGNRICLCQAGPGHQILARAASALDRGQHGSVGSFIGLEPTPTAFLGSMV
jgi:hypothetical protein